MTTPNITLSIACSYICQSWQKVRKSWGEGEGGLTSSHVVGIICPHMVGIRLPAKIWGWGANAQPVLRIRQPCMSITFAWYIIRPRVLRVVPPKPLICLKAMPLDLLLENNIFSRTNNLLDLQCSEERAIKEHWACLFLSLSVHVSFNRAFLIGFSFFNLFLIFFNNKMSRNESFCDICFCFGQFGSQGL